MGGWGWGALVLDGLDGPSALRGVLQGARGGRDENQKDASETVVRERPLCDPEAGTRARSPPSKASSLWKLGRQAAHPQESPRKELTLLVFGSQLTGPDCAAVCYNSMRDTDTAAVGA